MPRKCLLDELINFYLTTRIFSGHKIFFLQQVKIFLLQEKCSWGKIFFHFPQVFFPSRKKNLVARKKIAAKK